MTAKLDKPVTREAEIVANGVHGAIHVTMGKDGIAIRGKGTKREFRVPYRDIVEIAVVPKGMPPRFNDNKLGWLIDITPKKDKGNTAPSTSVPDISDPD